VRDQLGAELVAGYFEDIGMNDAARLEARLGGLAQALVVEDPRASARALAMRPDRLPDVLLVSRDVDLESLMVTVEDAAVGERDVMVEDGIALRVSRIPSHPRLGRRAREQRAGELRAEAALKGPELEDARSLRRELERLTADAEALLVGHTVWLAGDPALELISVNRATIESEALLERHRGMAAKHGEAAHALRPRIDGLRALLGEAVLLDPPDHSERASALARDSELGHRAKDIHASRGRQADLVESQLEALRWRPLSEPEVVRLTERVQELKKHREQLDSGIEALRYVREHVDALGWEEAPRRLADHHALVPALEAQLREAEAEQNQAEVGARHREQHYDEATARFQEADGHKRLAAQEQALASEKFNRIGVTAPTPSYGRRVSGATAC
jgi:chromosome partition protein MukB